MDRLHGRKYVAPKLGMLKLPNTCYQILNIYFCTFRLGFQSSKAIHQGILGIQLSIKDAGAKVEEQSHT